MKTYKDQKKENKAKLHWLKKVADEDFQDVIGVFRGRSLDMVSNLPYLDVMTTAIHISAELGEFIQKIHVEGLIKEAKVILD